MGLDIQALHKAMTFDDIAGWIEEHASMLAPQTDFYLREVRLSAVYSTVKIGSWNAPSFYGVLKFRASHVLSIPEAAALFKDTGIIVVEGASWAANQVVTPGQHTHSLSVHLLAHEWLVLATTYKLTHEH